MRELMFAIVILAIGYCAGVLKSEHDELAPINLTQEDCQHGCYR